MAVIPQNAAQLVASSGNVAAAIAAATLVADAARRTFITGFEITGAGATAGLPVVVTVSGIQGGTLSYIYTAATGATAGNNPLIVEFPEPIPSSAINTAITVSCPSLGAGSTNNAVVAHGFTQ